MDIVMTKLKPNNHDVCGAPEWLSYDSKVNDNQNCVYDFRSIYLEEDKFREQQVDYVISITDELVVAK